MEGVPIDTFLRQARTNDTPVSKDAITLNDAAPSFTASFTAPADGTAVSIAIDYLKAEVYRNGLPDLTSSHLVLTLDGEQIASWQGLSLIHIYITRWAGAECLVLQDAPYSHRCYRVFGWSGCRV